MSHRKRWLVTLHQTRRRLEVVYGDTREEALIEAEKAANAATSDGVWADPEWIVAAVSEDEEKEES